MLTSSSLKYPHVLFKVARSSSAFGSSYTDDGHTIFFASRKNAGTENVSRRLRNRDRTQPLVSRFVNSGKDLLPLLLDLPGFPSHVSSIGSSKVRNIKLLNHGCIMLAMRHQTQQAACSWVIQISMHMTWFGTSTQDADTGCLRFELQVDFTDTSIW